MRAILLSFIFFVTGLVSAEPTFIAQSVESANINYSHVLKKLNTELAGPVYFTHGGHHMALTRNGNVVDLAGGKFLINKNQKKVGFFAMSPRGTPFAIQGKKFGPIFDGKVWPALSLPNEGMKFVIAQNNNVFFFGGSSPHIYLYQKPNVTLLATLPDPVVAAATAGEKLYVATTRGVFLLENKKKPRFILRAPKGETFKSLAADPLGAQVFFTTEVGVYVIRKDFIFPFVIGITGQLHYNHPVLTVVKPGSMKAYGFTGMNHWGSPAEEAHRELAASQERVATFGGDK